MEDALLILAILPSILLGWYVYKKDMKEKEPIKLLIGLFFGGIGALVLSAILESVISLIFAGIYETDNLCLLFIISMLGIGLIEEGTKWLITFLITWKNKEFDYIYDAIVYMVFVSLGFATVENILYVFEYGIFTAILRAVLSVPGHAFFAIFMGYYYGMAKQASVNKQTDIMVKNLCLSILIPIFLHGAFDFLILANTWWGYVLYGILVIFLYIMAFHKVKQLSKIDIHFTNEELNSKVEISKEEKKTMYISNYNYTYTNHQFCKYCGTRTSTPYCPICGNYLGNMVNIPKHNYCTYCGKPAIGHFCTYCGKKLD